jgi:hypothetical protein
VTTAALEALTREIEQDRSLDEPERLRQRIDALDRLEVYFLDRQDQTRDTESPTDARLHDRATAVCVRLEAINSKFYQAIRSEIRQGRAPKWLLEQVIDCSRDGGGSRAHENRYDYLDVAVSGILQFDEPVAEVTERTAEMVFYQPTPARHVFDLIGRAALTERDVLVDLGSGLGHVPLLTSICTNARSIGIEREAAYVDCARQCALALNLSNATFLQQDARDGEFSSGTVFYLYTPFTGAILRAVLDSLRREAAARPIRVGTYGPCTRIVAEERWLEAVGMLQAGRAALFRSL